MQARRPVMAVVRIVAATNTSRTMEIPKGLALVLRVSLLVLTAILFQDIAARAALLKIPVTIAAVLMTTITITTQPAKAVLPPVQTAKR